MPARRLTTVACAAFGLTTAAHLAAHLTGRDALADASQWFLMPLLGTAVWAATRPDPTTGRRRRTRLTRLTLVALGFSWLGDTAPDLTTGDGSFLVMVGCFLLAQVTYSVAFVPYRGSGAPARPVLLLPYGAALATLLALCLPAAGGLAVPVVVYGACLTTMAALATGLNRWAGVGAAVFLVSDSLIALGAFTSWYAPPAPGFWVMVTYTAGQALIARGVVVADRASARGEAAARGTTTASGATTAASSVGDAYVAAAERS